MSKGVNKDFKMSNNNNNSSLPIVSLHHQAGGTTMTTTAATSSSSLSPSPTPPPSSSRVPRAEFVKGTSSQYVKLNVGGSLFYTTIGTLTKYDSMLRAMFSGRMEVRTDSDSWVLIDRCGKHFGSILNFLRDGTVPLQDNNRRELNEILAEAKYYLIQELINLIESSLTRLNRDNVCEAICRVPIITSSREEASLISSTSRPVVKLLINRHNNKYSYTAASDDNLLKTLELFDKLCLRFSGRVLFIKDVIGGNEICCWYFFGHGKKVSEVSTSSIVYATDRKHTKVDFPEARIYEETLNILLYESRQAPDYELMQATRSTASTIATLTPAAIIDEAVDDDQ